MRSFATAVVLCLLVSGAAQAKLNPAFSKQNAEPGDTLELDLGDGSEQFLGPLRIFLVSLEGDDRPQFKIGELGTLGELGRSHVLRFKVPDLPEGEYTVAIWFKGSLTGRWANALEGINPLLTIGAVDKLAASPAPSDEQTAPPLWPVSVAVCALVAAIVAFGWRRATRRPTAARS